MSRRITASTRLAAVIGDPVRHSLSPALHNAAYASAALDWMMVAIPAAAGTGSAMVDLVRCHDLGGLAVTMPLKSEVADAVDRLDPAAAALRSVNTVVADPDGPLGMSTDGDGFVASLRSVGHEPSGARVVVLGAGAAARSIVDALGRAGVASLVIHNRTASAASEAAGLAAQAITVDEVGLVQACAAADIIVNTTSVGMGAANASGDMPLGPELLSREHVVADIVYHPLATPLLVAARSVGADVVDGLGMLVHQAALQCLAWTGVEVDTAAMRAAAEAELASRHR